MKINDDAAEAAVDLHNRANRLALIFACAPLVPLLLDAAMLNHPRPIIWVPLLVGFIVITVACWCVAMVLLSYANKVAGRPSDCFHPLPGMCNHESHLPTSFEELAARIGDGGLPPRICGKYGVLPNGAPT